MKITVLAENTPFSDEFNTEHGLSLYIETEKHKILFDTGQTELFAENAEKLGIDLRDVDFAVISHGHYDHSGGLKKFLELNTSAPVYLSSHAFEPHYSGLEKYIGMDTSLEKNERLIFTDNFLKIDDDLMLFSCNDKEKLFPLDSAGWYMKSGDELSPDNFIHEQYLMITENGRNILISGCSHKGILNIAHWFSPDVLIGGFHFMKLDVDTTDCEKLESSAKILENTGIDFYTCHCTGTAQYEFLKKHINKLHYISCGQEITI